MRIALEKLGYNPDNHRSQGISEELLSWADEVIVMGNVHAKHIAERYPNYIQKVILWLVDDPHFATGTEKHCAVAKQIEALVLNRYAPQVQAQL